METDGDKKEFRNDIAQRVKSSRSLAAEIARRKHAEKLLQERERELALVDQNRQEFLAMLGHELRNPLAPITTSLCMMRRLRCDEPGIIQSRQIIERQVSLMTRLVNDLLDASRISQGKIELDCRKVSLASIVATAVELARPLLDQHHHKLSMQLPDTNVSLFVDPERLSQALANLLNNAAQYTEAQGDIQLSAAVLGGHLIFSVRDNGSGLQPGQQESIFKLFSQGNHSMNQAHGGLGVGLTLARTIIELHGGQVHASSAGPGCGSQFTIRLPLPGACQPADS